MREQQMHDLNDLLEEGDDTASIVTEAEKLVELDFAFFQPILAL